MIFIYIYIYIYQSNSKTVQNKKLNAELKNVKNPNSSLKDLTEEIAWANNSTVYFCVILVAIFRYNSGFYDTGLVTGITAVRLIRSTAVMANALRLVPSSVHLIMTVR